MSEDENKRENERERETSRREVELALEASERRFRAIFDSASQLQLLLDCDGIILEANRAAAEMAGVPSGALRGKRILEALGWDRTSPTVAQVRER